MSTMLDMAKRAGVALNTVSYAVNGTCLSSKCSRIIDLFFPVSERGTRAQYCAGVVAVLHGGVR